MGYITVYLKKKKSQKTQTDYTDEDKEVSVNYLLATRYIRITINMGN